MDHNEVSRRYFESYVLDSVLEAICKEDVDRLQILIQTRFGFINSHPECLYSAVEQGNLNIVEMLLDAGIDREYYLTDADISKLKEERLVPAYYRQSINCREIELPFLAQSCDRISPLHQAYDLEDVELRWKMIRLLTVSGVNPAKENLYSTSTLYTAALRGDCEMVKFLYDAGATVRCPRDYGLGHSPLHAAIYHLDGENRVRMVGLLIELGADPDAETCFQERCVQLLFNQKNCRCEVLKLLLDAGAQLNYLDAEDPLTIAIKEGDFEVMRQMIAAGADVNITRGFNISPLHVATLEFQRDSVQLLLENGADPNSMDEYGNSILSSAAAFKNPDKEFEYIGILKLLLAHGADINCTQEEDFIPFVTVVRCGTLEAMHLFFQNGVTLDNYGSVPLLHHAAQNNTSDVLKFLLETRRYDVDQIRSIIFRDKPRGYHSESTPLCVAISWRKSHNVKLLIEWGADVHIPCICNSEGDKKPIIMSPLLQAMKFVFSSDEAELLLCAGAKIIVNQNDEIWQPVLNRISNMHPRKRFDSRFDLIIGEAVLIKSQRCDSENQNILVQRIEYLSSRIAASCSRELNKLKSIQFYGSLSLYDLLRGCDVTRFVNNRQVIQDFESLDLLKLFPIYGNRIRISYSLALSKREVMDKALSKLNEILHFRFQHYREILISILLHLPMKDLRKLCIA